MKGLGTTHCRIAGFITFWPDSRHPTFCLTVMLLTTQSKYSTIRMGEVMPDETRKIHPIPSIRRLPGYLRLLKQMRRDGIPLVSCTHIAKELDLDSTQVRKDLALTGITGKPRVGYDREALENAIESYLGWDRMTPAYLIGAGNLGRALLGYENFRKYGLNIIAAFDTDKEIIGQNFFGRSVYSTEQLAEMAHRDGVQLGILTVPAISAQAAADILVAGGFAGIWNFSPAKLEVPTGVTVENVELSSSLAVLSCRMAVGRQ